MPSRCRIVTLLEHRYAEFDGLNLTWETLEGLVKHNGPLTDGDGRGLDGAVPQPILDYCASHDLELDRHAGLEAQAAALADDIAYDTHDIDDGLRAGLLTLDMLEEVSLPAGILSEVRRLYPSLDSVRTGHELMRRQITMMVEDAISTATARIGELAPRSVDDIHAAGRPMVAFSEGMKRGEQELKAFLYANLYRHPQVMEVRARADRVVDELFDRYMQDDSALPEAWRGVGDEAARARKVADFLAGMTDTYAIKEHRRLFDHTPDFV
jgi:dGTPase